MRVFVPGITDLLGYRAMLADFFEAMRHNRPPAYTLTLAQRDLKRMLAYSSVENIGIIIMGLGIGMLGLSADQFNRAQMQALAFADTMEL